MWKSPAVRIRPNIGHYLDTMTLQLRRKIFNRLGGVAYRVDVMHGGYQIIVATTL